MQIFKRADDLTKYLDNQQKKGKKLGFVPTMGALHAGHMSLIRESNSGQDLTVCSIFVNPTQFNDPADFEKYPVTIEADIKLLLEADCDILYLPHFEDIYPKSFTPRQFDLGNLEHVFEGKYRPGHFQGVCMVVDRLLEIVSPDALYLGQKDFQQCMVLKQMLEITNRTSEIDIIICPTLREQSGLAMSSRNARLNDKEKEQATSIYNALHYAKLNFGSRDVKVLEEECKDIISKEQLTPEYFAIVNADDLSPITDDKNEKQVVAITAAYAGEVRLIDNMILN